MPFRLIGCAACERYKRKGVAHSGDCTREAVLREETANRGGTAIFLALCQIYFGRGRFLSLCPRPEQEVLKL